MISWTRELVQRRPSHLPQSQWRDILDECTSAMACPASPLYPEEPAETAASTSEPAVTAAATS